MMNIFGILGSRTQYMSCREGIDLKNRTQVNANS